MSSERPKVQPDMQIFDWVIEGAALIFLVGMFIEASMKFPDLPSEIPTHFNANGDPDAFGGRGSIWTMPVIGLFMYLLFSFLQRYPHVYNLPAEINEHNAKKVYGVSVQMMRALKLLIVLTFGFINHRMLLTALEQANGLGSYFLPAMLVLYTVTLIFYFVNLNRAAKR